jgi:aminopeptidase N
VRFDMRTFLAERLHEQFLYGYETFATPGPYSPDAAASGRRALRNLCLAFLMDLGEDTTRRACLRQLDTAGNMTDAMAALAALANCDCPERRPALDGFYAKWQDEALVVDKWLATGAVAPAGTAERAPAHHAPGLHAAEPQQRSAFSEASA